MVRRLAVVGALLIVLVGVPRSSEAGLLEIIWEMSGPRMFGLAYGCMINVKTHSLEECRLGQPPTLVTAANTAALKGQATAPDPEKKKTFLVLGGSLLGSTGHDSKNDDGSLKQGYDWGEIWMLAFEPGVARRFYDNGRIQLHYGTGVSYELLFGRDIKRFDKFAFTATPIDVSWKHLAGGLRFRMYPHGFSDDEFKPGPLVKKDRGFEFTWGFTASIRFFHK